MRHRFNFFFLVQLLVICGSSIPYAAPAQNEKVLLLVPRSIPRGSINAESFALALKIQLQPFSARLVHKSWAIPKSEAEQRAVARLRGERQAATAVVWYALSGSSAQSEVTIYTLFMTGPGAEVQSSRLGGIVSGIERTMAASVRTQLQVGRWSFKSPTKKNSAKRHLLPSTRPRLKGEGPLRKEVPKRSQEAAPLLQLGLGYGLLYFPVGGTLRDGPLIFLTFPLWKSFVGQLKFQYHLPLSGENAHATYRLYSVAGATTILYRVSLGKVVLAPGLGLRWGSLTADASPTANAAVQEEAHLWELAVDGVISVHTVLARRVTLAAQALVGGLPLRYLLKINGQKVLEAGRVELGLTFSVSLAFW